MTTKPPASVDDAPQMFPSGRISFRIDNDLFELPVPRIGQLRKLRQRHWDINDEINQATRESVQRLQDAQDELAVITDQRKAKDLSDEDYRALARKANDLVAELDRIERQAQRDVTELREALAVGWVREACSLLGRPIPEDDDDLPIWCFRLSTVKDFLEHWMTHPSPRGV